MTSFDAAQVTRAASLVLSVDESAVWAYAVNHREVIDEHWRLATADNPNFFNGTVHVLKRKWRDGATVFAELMAVEFKAFLYWRDEGFPAEARVEDVFGSALIRSREGHVILGRQQRGNINEGLAYLPGGFIDPRDVTRSGQVDIDASILRELAEETGLTRQTVEAQAGYLVTETFPHNSYAVVFTSHLDSASLCERIRCHIAAEENAELAEPVVLTSPADMQGLAVAHYARVLINSALAWS